MIVHFLWIGNKVITYIWWAKTGCLFLFLLWAISFTSCETSPCRILKYLWGKLKQRNRGLEGTPCVSEPCPPLALGHITQCLSSAVRTPSYNLFCAPILALEVCSLQCWLLNWLDNIFQFPCHAFMGSLSPFVLVPTLYFIFKRPFPSLMFNLLVYL